MPKLLKPNKPEVTVGAGDAVKGVSGFDVGMRQVGFVLGLGAVGLLVDRWMGWGPWLMLAGIVVGFVGWLVDVARSR